MAIRKGRTQLVIAAVALCAVLVGASAAGAVRNAKPVKEIEVLSLWGGSEKDAFLKVARAFTAKTGIKVRYTRTRAFEPDIRRRLAARDLPDVVIFTRPGVLANLAKEGLLKDVRKLGLSQTYLRARYGRDLISLVTLSGKIYGVPAKGNSKSTIWYRPDQFEKYGLERPKTWAELLAITRKLKARGKTPWTAGAKDSWTLTDWFENVYLKAVGPTKYQRLFTGKIKFTDPSVKRSLKLMLQILSGKYLAGGVQGALATGYIDAVGRVFGPHPTAQLYLEGGFIGGIALNQVNTALEPGRDIAFFPVPAISRGSDRYVVFGGDYASAFRDNAAVRQFLKYISSPGAGSIWVSTGAVVSPNRQVRTARYPNQLVGAEAKQIATAKALRYDGSDLLSGDLGDEWGAVLQKILQRTGNTDRLLSAFQRKAQRQS
jgi:alpha-glucoside transport system substrate-binding protein